jgi:hypothetical protein
MLRDAEERKGFDGAVEGISRYLASRRTRRSFMGWLGRGSVLVAGGSSLVGLLAGRAEARVCGQSGVSPKCANYDCVDAVWGWCWYANGCCAGGRLKKICDCCAPVNNVHGYCPSGTNVKCIVESCGTDPRVQTVPVARVQTDNPIEIATAFSRTRFGKNSKPVVVLSNVDDALSAAVAATVAAALGGPLLLTTPDVLSSHTISELQRLGSTDVQIVGLGLAAAIDSSLTSYGRSPQRPFNASDHAALSVEVADWVQAKTKTTRAICVEASGTSLSMAPLAGAAAASKGMMLLVGTAAAAAKSKSGVGLTYMVGDQASAGAGQVAGSKAIRGDKFSMAAELATYMASVEKANVATVTLAPWDSNVGLAASPGLVLLHARPGALDGARDWMFANRSGFRQAFAVGATGGLNNDGYYETQSVVNGFEAHLLIGVSGEGLPVISQPESERPLGRARTSPLDSPPATSNYWTDRG